MFFDAIFHWWNVLLSGKEQSPTPQQSSMTIMDNGSLYLHEPCNHPVLLILK